MPKNFFFALLLFAIAGLSQPLPAAGTGAGKSSSDSKTGSQKTPSDSQIEQAIRVKLARSKMSADHFTVSVVKAVATIEGSTGVMQHKGAMTRMAKSCGATSVRNNIHVSDEAKAKTAASLSKAHEAKAASGATGTSASATSNGGPTAASAASTIPRATVVRPDSAH